MNHSGANENENETENPATMATAMKAMTATVTVDALTVAYRKKVALDGVALAFGGGVHGLLGPNGAGKTSLIRVLATVAAPAGGRVTALGHDLTAHRGRTEVRRRLGYLPQEFGYYPGFTVREFVTYVAWLKEMDPARVPEAVARAAGRVGLADRIDAKVKTLSGGMVRRVGIAQAIVNDPELLLLDEPTAGLDLEQRVEFRALLRELGTRATVIVSTHLVEDVAAACTEVTLLEAGRVAFRGTTEELTALGAYGAGGAGGAAGIGSAGVVGGATGAGSATGAGGTEGARGAGGATRTDGAARTDGATRMDGAARAGCSAEAAGGAGETPVERGYLAALRAHRAAAAAGTAAGTGTGTGTPSGTAASSGTAAATAARSPEGSR